MTIEAIASAMRDGYTFVCASCEHLQSARAQGRAHCIVALRGGHCVGPFGGGHYEAYRGPLDGHHSEYCFVCGARSDGAVAIRGRNRLHLVGVCSEHMDRLNDVSPKGANPPGFITHETVQVIGS